MQNLKNSSDIKTVVSVPIPFEQVFARYLKLCTTEVMSF
jgi:hypothetical protein